jgi:molecular chaperone GrpE
MTGPGKQQPDTTQGRDRFARVKVSDKRRTSDTGEPRGDASSDAAPAEAAEPQAKSTPAAEADALRGQVETLTNDLMRLQAEFDNYRKRMMRNQADVAQQTVAGFVKKLLPVLDNFDRALEHDADDNIALLHKELVGVLAAEGIEEIPAQGARFDPHLHEAVESIEDEEASEPIVRAVYRTGYRFGPKVLRHSMVGVARPAEGESEKTEQAATRSDVAAGESQPG